MMKQTYFAILTAKGKAKFALAIANKTTIKLTRMAFGDGNGAVPKPDRERTFLINERCRAPINTLSVDPDNIYQLIAEQIIPGNLDSSWIREVGLFDDEGELFALANRLPSDKPRFAERSGHAQLIRVVFIVTDPHVIELHTDDPNVILATRKYVDDAVKEVREKSAPIDSPTFIGTPNAPTPEQDNNSEQLATTAFVQTLQEITGKRYVTPKQGDERYWKRDDKLFPDRRNGYQVLPSRLILQWGWANLPTGGGDWVKFPIAFPNEIMQVCLTCNGTGCFPCSVNFEPGQTTGFIAFGINPWDHQYRQLPVYWFAIGH